ncbi:26S proteasome subunit RPN7-domain-containing protein [Xylaria bambusicola]|uniref:26S proteasome subunit RPN7-domain-containing protein n=1 Tax=Xylaria bambusicola TaxID=326684 RepID=UPI0020086268|nr:26S proteasome subunit RPN7-domain-containing protein [Xylaria bambusicola]KAI0512748.1 26S proteasome subunit RPN7-domain-containing protein [Xylaria bambusicola]
MASGTLAFFTAMEEQGRIIVNDVPKFDLELYISNYRGRTRFDRLLLIGQCSVPLGLDALKAAVAEAKKGKDVQRYRDAWECIRMAAPDEPEAQLDEAWVNNTGKLNRNLTHQLEAELKGYKNNLIKESIRIGHRDLGEHLEDMGNLNGAIDAYLKMRSEASATAHVIDTNKHIISVLLQKRDWSGILGYANKLVNPGSLTEEITAHQPYQKMVAGLAYLGSEKYDEAAKCFLDAGDPIICQRSNDVASSNDIATYGGLLALASMGRDELQEKVLDNSSFRNYLELEPQLRKAISMFVNCRYSACLQILERYRADYLLDIYLQSHVPKIFSMIRKKCIVQYLVPFSCVTLANLNAVFAKPGESLEAELISMIKSGALSARINTIDKVLVTVSSEPRVAMQMNALQTVRDYHKEALEQIRRMNIAQAELEVKGPVRKGVSGSAGSGSLPGISDMLSDDIMSESTQVIEGVA